MSRAPGALTLLAGLLAAYLIAPFAAGLVQAGGADWSGADVRGLASALAVSVASATLSTAIVVLGGVPLGHRLARTRSRGGAILGFLVQLPLALPPLTSGVLLLFLLGYASPLGRLTRGALTDSFAGVVLAEVFVSSPFLIIAARSAFAGVDPSLRDVAATLGHGPWAIFRRVDLPVARRALLAGALLAWLRAFGEFGATAMVAYHPYSLPVFTYIAFGSEGLPAMAPVIAPTLAAAILMMGLMYGVARPAPVARARAEPGPGAPATAPVRAVPVPRAAPFEVRGRRTLDGFTLDVAWRASAERLAILGASGSGKSMTLRLIAGLDRSVGDRVRLGERDLGRLPAQARGIGYVPQAYGLMPHLRLAEQVGFAVDAEPQRAREWTTRLGLQGLEGRSPYELSLGQQQRVALARALARRAPDLLLLDEPFSALDAGLRIRLRGELAALQAQFGLTTILVTHDPDEAMLLADELLLLDRGRVLQTGSVQAVWSRPVGLRAARLLGADVFGRGRAAGAGAVDVGGVVLDVGGAPLAPGAALGWAVRSRQVQLAPPGAAGCPATVLQRGPVREGVRRVRLRLGETEMDLAAAPSCPPEGPCVAQIDPEAVQVWSAGQDSDESRP